MHLLACLQPIWWRTIVACLIGSVIRIKNDDDDDDDVLFIAFVSTRSYIICQRTCTGHNCNAIYIYKITNTAVTTQFVYYPTKYTIYD